MAILALLVPIMFLLLGFGEILKFDIYQLGSFGLIDVVIFSIVFIWLLYVKKTTYKLKIPIILFLGALAFSLLINAFNYTENELFTGFMYFVRLALYFSLYFIFVDIGKKFKLLIPKLMLMSGLIFLFIGFYQFVFFEDLRPYYGFGWDLHVGRIFSSFFDPNFAGIFFVLIFLFFLILKKELFKKQWFPAYYALLVLNLLAIILTYSRGAFVSLFAGIISFSILTKNFKLIGLLFVIFICFFAFSISRPNLESTNLLRTASIDARLDSSKEALYIWKENPLGVGFNTYRYARLKIEDDPGIISSNSGAGVENSFLFILATAGVLGILSLGYLIYKILNDNFCFYRKNKYSIIVIVSMFSLMTNSLFINSMFFSYIFIWMVVLIGFTESISRE